MPFKYSPNYNIPLADATDLDITQMDWETEMSGSHSGSFGMIMDTQLKSISDKVTALEKTPSTVYAQATKQNATNYISTVTGLTEYITNMNVVVSLSENITGATTLQINTLSPIYIKKYDILGNLIDLTANQLRKGTNYILRYNGEYFILQNPIVPSDFYMAGTEGNLLSIGANGVIQDSGKKASDFDVVGAAQTVQGNLNAHTGADNPHTNSEALLKNAVDKVTIVDADSIPLVDTEDLNKSKKITFGLIKNNIKSYFDTLFVPLTRKINNKPLSTDITLNASDVGAVPIGRKINNKPLSSDILLNASDVGAYTKAESDFKFAEKLNSDITVYVATTGSDSLGDGTEIKPYATIQKAMSVIPKNLNGYNAKVFIAEGNYNLNNYVITGFFGGQLILMKYGSNKPTIAVTTRMDTINNGFIVFVDIKFQGSNKTGEIYVYNSNVEFKNCEFDNLSEAINAYENAKVTIHLASFTNNRSCVISGYASNVGGYALSGATNNDRAYVATMGGGIGISTSTLSATTMYAKDNGWILDGNVFR